jgi:hypothetical protein
VATSWSEVPHTWWAQRRWTNDIDGFGLGNLGPGRTVSFREPVSCREKEASALAPALPLETCVDLLAGDLKPPLDPLRVSVGSTQRQEIAANAELTGVSETGN